VLVTGDAGRSWTRSAAPTSWSGVSQLSFTDVNHGVLAYGSQTCAGTKASPGPCQLTHGLAYLANAGRTATSIQPPG